MARKRYTAEPIIGHLRQAEILISEGNQCTKRDDRLRRQVQGREERRFGSCVNQAFCPPCQSKEMNVQW